MAESCSSNAINGCSTCSPSLSLFGISALTNVSKIGFTCLNSIPDGKVYWNKTEKTKDTSAMQGEGSGGYPNSQAQLSAKEKANGSCNSSNKYFYAYRITKYGEVQFDMGYSTNTQGNGNSSWDPNGAFQYYFCDAYYDECTCEPTSSGGGGTISTNKQPFEEETSSNSGTIDCGPGPGRVWGGSCNSRSVGASQYSCYESSSEDVSCTTSTTTSTGSDSLNNAMLYLCGGLYARTLECRTDPSNLSCYRAMLYSKSRNYNTSNVTNISNDKDLDFFFGIAVSSVNTKIDIYEFNKPQNSNGDNCGEGKDACWEGAGSFQIADNNLDDPNATSTTAQKLKFKIGTPKEEFNKEYKSVSGKVYFYYDGDGKTPCCDEDFDGTVVKEQDYSISAGETFKNDYFASDAGDFDNNDQSLVGKTINICYTIDNVSFI
jgi:hypothetical protein